MHLNKVLYFFVFIILLTWHHNANAGVLMGVLSDGNMEPLPYASVYIQGTTIGTSTNINGEYKLKLSPGSFKVAYRNIGYRLHIEEITIKNDTIIKNISLKPEGIAIQEVTVTGVRTGKDPAYSIMKKAIESRSEHLKEVKSYDCRAYIKSKYKLLKSPKKIFGQDVIIPGTDENNTGIIYLSESVSEFSFQAPAKYKEVMISSKVSGDDRGFSWNNALSMNLSFYRNMIELGDIADRGLISPLSSSAFFYYRFKYLGSMTEHDHLIHKIKVTPKRNGDPAFTGTVYILDKSWKIYSTSLSVDKSSGVNYIDSLMIKQVYIPVKDSIWLMGTQKFGFTFNLFGFMGYGANVGVYSNYKLDLQRPKKFFRKEIWKVEEKANERDSIYWETIRPIPLVKEEIKDYKTKDSLIIVWDSKEYKDSIDKKTNKFKLTDILLGYNYTNTTRHESYAINPLIETMQFNTVEGFVIEAIGDYERRYPENRRRLNISQSLRYGFSSGELYGLSRLSWRYNRMKFSKLDLEGGRYVFQFNRDEPIRTFINSLYTLVEKQNFLKLYQGTRFGVKHRSEVSNGIMLYAGLSYEKRTALINDTESSLVKEPTITSNNPEDPQNESLHFDPNSSTEISFRARLRLKQQYFTRPKTKINVGSPFPTIDLKYRKAIPGIFGSEANFDVATVSLNDEFRLGIIGRLRVSATYGNFINDSRMWFMDKQHFLGNQTIFLKNNFSNFQLLNYYSHSTADYYFTGHAEHHFRGFWFNKLPVLRRLKFHSLAGFDYLYTPVKGFYAEVSIGVERIARLGRLEFVTAFGDGSKLDAGFRFGLVF